VWICCTPRSSASLIPVCTSQLYPNTRGLMDLSLVDLTGSPRRTMGKPRDRSTLHRSEVLCEMVLLSALVHGRNPRRASRTVQSVRHLTSFKVLVASHRHSPATSPGRAPSSERIRYRYKTTGFVEKELEDVAHPRHALRSSASGGRRRRDICVCTGFPLRTGKAHSLLQLASQGYL
jgi:hypothetical protein